MKFNQGSMFKYLSVKLPTIGAFILVVLIPFIEFLVQYQLVPQQYHAFITGVVLVFLTWIGRKIHQPELVQLTKPTKGARK